MNTRLLAMHINKASGHVATYHPRPHWMRALIWLRNNSPLISFLYWSTTI